MMPPIELGTIVAAGRAADGRLYVLDRTPEGDERIFVSNGSVLRRRRSSGSGTRSSPDGDAGLTHSFEDGADTRRLVVEIRGGEVIGIALASRGAKTFFDELGDEAERLAIVDSGEVVGMAVENLPGEVLIEHFATSNDGRQVLVTRPRDDWSYEDFRVYFGTPPELREQPVESVIRAKDGGSTHVVFRASDATFDAFFPSRSRTPISASTLQSQGMTWSLVVQEPESVQLDDLTFTCL